MQSNLKTECEEHDTETILKLDDIVSTIVPKREQKQVPVKLLGDIY